MTIGADRDHLPLPPDTCWGTEVRELMRDHGYTFDEASDRVIIEFLEAGDLRPLVDLLLRGRMEPGESVGQYVAGMLAGDRTTPFRFGFKETLKRGRPSRNAAKDDRVLCAIEAILCGARTASNGTKPGWPFWNYLLATLDYSRVLVGWKPNVFPLRAGIFPIIFPAGDALGRRCDPGLRIRDKLLARMVQERIDHGEKYDAAVSLTLEAIQIMGRPEHWGGSLSLTTIRNAYDSAAKTVCKT